MKYRYVLKNIHTGAIHFKWYTINQIEKSGLKGLFDIENYKAITRDRISGRKDLDSNVIYENDICELYIDISIDTDWNTFNQSVTLTGVVKYTPSIGFHLKITKGFDRKGNIPLSGFPSIKNIVSYRTKVIGNIHN